MKDIELFELNRDYFDGLDESAPIDADLERHAETLDRIDRELEGAKDE